MNVGTKILLVIMFTNSLLIFSPDRHDLHAQHPQIPLTIVGPHPQFLIMIPNPGFHSDHSSPTEDFWAPAPRAFCPRRSPQLWFPPSNLGLSLPVCSHQITRLPNPAGALSSFPLPKDSASEPLDPRDGFRFQSGDKQKKEA